MIQLNLLPDVKLEYIKTKRTHRLITSISLLICLVSVVILGLVLSVDVAQKLNLNNLNRNISAETNKLQNEPQINKILTVQNQLESIPSLDAARPATTRLLDFLNQVTPSSVSISSLNVDFTKQTIVITGSADSIASINTYVDTLKFTDYTSGGVKQGAAFSNVVLSSFGINRNSQNSDQAASYTINFSYNANLFKITQNTALVVPQLTTTRSVLEEPTDLFKAAPSSGTTNSTTGGGGN